MTWILKAAKNHCRCTRKACEARCVKAKHPNEYRRPPVCPTCRKGGLRVDGYRMGPERRRIRAETCNCGYYHHPHRRGGGWCIHNPRLTDQDLEDMQQSRRYLARH